MDFTIAMEVAEDTGLPLVDVLDMGIESLMWECGGDGESVGEFDFDLTPAPELVPEGIMLRDYYNEHPWDDAVPLLGETP